jgi:expansin (peptidoglycan-binding protein)
MWKGGPIAGEYSEANRHAQIAVPTLRTLQASWSAKVTANSWSDALSPSPVGADLLMAEPTHDQDPAPSTPIIRGWATHYGESYQGGVLGCGTGYYKTDNPEIIAVGPSRYAEWPCGTRLRVCGPAGCITATRHDACPGCSPNVLDLSEAGNKLVCGDPPHTCRATVQLIELPQPGPAPNTVVRESRP